MIISHQHKFIFLKTEKTAGTSLEIALSKYCGDKDIITPITPNDEAIRMKLSYRGKQNYHIPFHKYSKIDWVKYLVKQQRLSFYNHMPATEIKEYVSEEVWNTYFKFCFERNPWDKTISNYHWRQHFGGEKYDSIESFIMSGMAGKIRGFEVYSIGGLPVVDQVYKFEELPKALVDISKQIRLKETLQMPTYKAKGNVRKDKRHYSEVLSEREKELIRKIFAREIAWWGYGG